MTVKSDSKGRLTGADPSTRYTRNVSSDGTITYVPEVPKEFDETREVTAEQFKAFFGADVHQVTEDGIQTGAFHGDKDTYFPNGLVITRLVLDADGNRVHRGTEVLKETVFIRIKR